MTGTGTTGAEGVGAARRLERRVPAETAGREEVAAGAGWVGCARWDGAELGVMEWLGQGIKGME